MSHQHEDEGVTPREDSAPLKPWYVNRYWWFLLFNVLLAVAFFGPLRDLMRISLSSDYDTYIPLIPFISAYLMYLNRKTIFSEQGSSVVGLLTVGIGILSLVFGRNYESQQEYRDYLALIVFSAVTIWIGGFIFLHGVKSFRAAAFPVLFLFLWCRFRAQHWRGSFYFFKQVPPKSRTASLKR